MDKINQYKSMGKNDSQIAHFLIHATKIRKLNLLEIKFVTDYLSSIENTILEPS